MSSSPARAYFVHGIELVNTGGELCDACGRRKAIGASVSGHLLCPRCAGLHSQLADELAQEIEESRQRRNQLPKPKPIPCHTPARKPGPRTPFRCGHPNTPTTAYTNRQGFYVCRECKTRRMREARQARRRAVT